MNGCGVLQAQASMPAIVYGSSSNVYGLNTKTAGVESDLVNKPASLAAATMRVSFSLQLSMMTHPVTRVTCILLHS